ncbi:hypothetical protein OS176_05755 [Xanthomonadaceae bacterium XH05]|nr:hypothetical protein [Xanthomonadaceae bacterium XH05]
MLLPRCFLLVFIGLFGAVGAAKAQWISGRLVPGVGMEANGASEAVDVSADGRTVVFSTSATNWVPEAIANTDKVMAVDLDTGLMEVASRTTGGGVIRGEAPVVSRDGRYVAFLHHGGNLNVGVPHANWQVARKDRVTGQLRLVSANSGGEASNAHVNDDWVAMSGDGRYIAFEATSSNLGIPSNGWNQVFVKDMDTGQIHHASATMAGALAPDGCSIRANAMSDNGRYVVMICNQPLIAGMPNGQAYVRDMTTNALQLISRASGVSGTPSTAFASRAAISSNGRFVSFQTRCYGGVGGDCTNNSGVYVRDLQSHVSTRIPRPAALEVDACSVSDVSDIGTVLMGCVQSGRTQVYLHIPGAAGTPFLVSETAAGQPGNGVSGATLAVNANGLSMVFDSLASDLASGDTNGVGDVFVFVDESIISGLFADSFE